MKIDERKTPASKIPGLHNHRMKSPFLTGEAEQIAISALGYLADDPARLDRFLALSGLNPQSLRAAAGEPGFLAAVLDHVAGDERQMLDFAASLPCDPADIAKARMILRNDSFETP